MASFFLYLTIKESRETIALKRRTGKKYTAYMLNNSDDKKKFLP